MKRLRLGIDGFHDGFNPVCVHSQVGGNPDEHPFLRNVESCFLNQDTVEDKWPPAAPEVVYEAESVVGFRRVGHRVGCNDPGDDDAIL